ncbi:hypothetical protein FPL09_01005 [Spiribacter vilamensis]|nr:circadian clock KaiB family protein [Spiribacter vilamensis]TVO62319.1 hypothetical protein FPL09_01005 [Spiribacter vilamensis]
MPRLILFVTGNAPRTQRARANLARMLEEIGRDDLTPYEIDLLQQPQEGLTYSVFATPSLLKTDDEHGGSLLYGDLSDDDRLYRFLADLATTSA